MAKKTGLARLPGYKRPLRPKEKPNKRIDVVSQMNNLEEFFSTFSEEQAERHRRWSRDDQAARAEERVKRREERASERLKKVDLSKPKQAKGTTPKSKTDSQRLFFSKGVF